MISVYKLEKFFFIYTSILIVKKRFKKAWIYKALCFDKAEWMGHPMRLELTRVGLLV